MKFDVQEEDGRRSHSWRECHGVKKKAKGQNRGARRREEEKEKDTRTPSKVILVT